jgi:tetratricopeptide (TPR) repeat protein
MEKRTVTIKRNAIENFMMAVKEYIKHHKKLVLVITAAVVLVAGLVVSGSIYYEIRSQKELLAFESIIEKYETGSHDDASLTEATAALLKIVEGSWWGYPHKHGYYIIAGMNYQNKRYEEARGYYLKYVDSSSSVFTPLALFQAGICSEALDQNDKAIEIYSKLEKNYGGTLFNDRILYDLGRVYQKKRDIVQAREYFTKLMTQYPASPFISEAKARLFLLGLAK